MKNSSSSTHSVKSAWNGSESSRSQSLVVKSEIVCARSPSLVNDIASWSSSMFELELVAVSSFERFFL